MKASRKTATAARRGEVLVAIMNNKADFGILRTQRWYRIPVASAPKRWPPEILAFYQTKVFGPEAFAIHYYGRVREIKVVERRDLFPNEPLNPKSERHYYQVHLESLKQLERPINSRRRRRIVFITTTQHKFFNAAEINDLFDDSPLEDRLWVGLRGLKIPAERQWNLKIGQAQYFLDFAVFCTDGCLNVETDGDTWHADRDRIPEDNRRDNALQAQGWHVLRFNSRQIRESLADYCVPQITKTINRLGGLSDEEVVSRVFYSLPDGTAIQLTLFDEGAEYEWD